MANKKNLTKGVTFRLPVSVVEKLESQTNYKQISLNTLVNQILRSFVEWDAKAVEAGWMVFPKPALKELVDRCDEKDLEKIAKRKAEYHKDIRLLMMGQDDLEGFLTLLRNRSTRSGFSFTENAKDDGTIHFVMQHDMGKKWSHFNKVLYMEMLNDLGYRVDIQTTANTMVLDIYRN